MTIQNMYRLLRALAICLLLAGCANNENKELLECLSDIQAMGDSCPQKAMLRLDSIRPLFENESEYMRNKFALLDIRLRDKAYITHTSDSTIKQVCGYFEKHGSDREKQEAYYYMGSVYRDMNDSPRAVTNYLKAIEIAEKSEDADPALMEVSYLQLSGIYQKQFKHNEALDLALKGLKIAERQGKATERTFMNVATTYFNIGDTLNTISLCDKTMDIILNNGVCKKNADIVSKALYYYTRANNEKDATLCHNLLKSLPHNELPRNYAPNLAIYYEKFVSEDSAAAIFRKLYDTTDRIGSKYDASRWLTKHYNDKGDYEQASKYAVRFIEANRAVVENMDYEYTNNAKNLFQYQRDKEEEAKIIQEAAKDRFNLVLGISTSTILLLSSIIYYYHRKKQLLVQIIGKEKSIREAKALVEEKETELKKEKKCIERKEKELAAMDITNSRLTQQLHKAEEDFRMLVIQNKELTRITLMNNFSENAGDIIEKVKKASRGKYRLNDEEWKNLLGAVDNLYPDFTHEVQSKFKRISEPLLRVCYLMKIGLSGPQIVNLTDYPRQTVWVRIKRIEKVFNGNVIG